MESTAVIMDWREKPWQTAFAISAAINCCIVLYFSLFAVVNFVINSCFKEDDQNRIVQAHKKIPNFMHCFYFNLVMYPCLVMEALFITCTSFPGAASYRGDLPYTVIVFFAVAFGIRVFLFGRDLLLLKNNKVKVMVLFVHAVFLLVVGYVILTESAAIMGIIIITCECENFVVNIGKLLRQLGYKHTPCYRWTMFLGCLTSIIFRAMVPLALLGVSLIHGKPFEMTPTTMAIFFFALVVYGIVNTWYVNSSVARISKRKARIIEVPYASFVQEVDDTLKEGQDEVPPSYQDACQPDLAVVSGGTDDFITPITTHTEEPCLHDQRMDQSQMSTDNRRMDMATIFQSDRGEPYYYGGNGAISHA